MRAVLAIALAGVAGAAVAAGALPAGARQDGDHGAYGGRFMERLDLDGDGAISRDEARSFGDLRFQSWDRNSDGAVTEAEMIEALQELVMRQAGKLFARLDANGDGRLERAELEAHGTALFDRIDANDDGQVSVEEVRAGWFAAWQDDESGTSDRN